MGEDRCTTKVLRGDSGLPDGVHVLLGSGPEARRIRLKNSPVLVGSGARCDVVLCDRAVSEEHFSLEICREGVVVVDQESTNGTWVDGVRMERGYARVGSHIRVGRSELWLASLEHTDDGRTLVFASTIMARLLAEISRCAPYKIPVLISGSTGSGKELVARRVHECSLRSESAFVSVNAGGMNEALISSELFGHEKGAFTGAHTQRMGIFEQAHNGTLFLDELGELPLSTQARLLRVLEEGEVRRSGSP